MNTVSPARPSRLRIVLGLIAAIAAIAVVAPGVASAKTQKVDSAVWMQAQPDGSGVPQAFLFGGVTSEKKACTNRTLYIYRQVPGDENSWDYGWAAFEVTADDGGGFTRYLSQADEAYDYTLTVGKEVIQKANKKIVCKGAFMTDVVIPRR